MDCAIRRALRGPVLAVAVLSAASSGCSPAPVAGAADTTAGHRREAALAAARVWQPPAVAVSQANLRDNPPGSPFGRDTDLHCRFVRREVGGTTPKFYCQLPGGEIVKVKYGATNPELPAEIAATRLLTALGFWTDTVYQVRSVHCTGCPRFPFHAMKCVQQTGLATPCLAGAGSESTEVFHAAVVERRIPGRVIQAYDDQGWGWFELDRIDPARGGASRAEVDALRLAAVLIAHWDNKPANQRLICRPGRERPDGDCAEPIAVVQDLGATFGPLKLDLQNWRRGRIWSDPERCAVSMEHFPWAGGTFPEGTISEGGRRLLLALLEELSDAQLRDLFEGAGVPAHPQFEIEAADPDAWVTTFKAKVEQIRTAGPCPAN